MAGSREQFISPATCMQIYVCLLTYNYNLLLVSYFFAGVTPSALLKRETIISCFFRFGSLTLIWTFCVLYIDISINHSFGFPQQALLYNRCFNKLRIQAFVSTKLSEMWTTLAVYRCLFFMLEKNKTFLSWRFLRKLTSYLWIQCVSAFQHLIWILS